MEGLPQATFPASNPADRNAAMRKFRKLANTDLMRGIFVSEERSVILRPGPLHLVSSLSIGVFILTFCSVVVAVKRDGAHYDSYGGELFLEESGTKVPFVVPTLIVFGRSR